MRLEEKVGGASLSKFEATSRNIQLKPCKFLKAVISQAKTNSTKANILALYNTKKERITEITHSQYAIRILDTIFARPIFNSADFIKTSKIPRPNTQRLLAQLKRGGVIDTIKPGGPRNAEVFAFVKLLKIVG